MRSRDERKQRVRCRGGFRYFFVLVLEGVLLRCLPPHSSLFGGARADVRVRLFCVSCLLRSVYRWMSYATRFRPWKCASWHYVNDQFTRETPFPISLRLPPERSRLLPFSSH